MNNYRRKQIAEAIGKIEEAIAILETVSGEEREYYDNLSENFQNSERGEKASETADTLDEALQSAEELRDNLTGIDA